MTAYLEQRRNHGGKLLRRGYTTGSCAAAAAKAAACLLLTGEAPAQVEIPLPGGSRLQLAVAAAEKAEGRASCAVRKDSGDDPDITDKILVYASVSQQAVGITVDGGAGVGRVTRPGLDQPVGAAAINHVPREMIAQSLREAAQQAGYGGGLQAVISIPEGERLAARTFNPRLGIIGGLSVIGTSGIVEPMSERAFADTIHLELAQCHEDGRDALLLTPGNYGEDFARETLGLCLAGHVSCSNFIGEAIDSAVELGFYHILLVGHIGKLCKLGVGILNTHSAHGDARMETLLACALAAGAELPLLRALSGCVTTDAALDLLRRADLLTQTMAELGGRIESCLQRRVPPQVEIGYICFTNIPRPSILMQSGNARKMMQYWRGEK